MRMIGVCVTICLVLAALKAAATVLALVIIAAIILAAINDPKQTLGCLGGLMCFTLIGQHPVPSILVLGAIIVAGKVTKPKS